jgi:hypothetical protein
MADLLTFNFARKRRLIHAGEVGPLTGWGDQHVALHLLCRPSRGVVVWKGSPAATLETVTCPRCRSRLARPAPPSAEGRDDA